jgi:hypothetical protein
VAECNYESKKRANGKKNNREEFSVNKITIAAGAAICTTVVVVASVYISGETDGFPDSISPIAADQTSTDNLTETAFGAGMHFTDERGVSRLPTPEERAELAAAFQADIARLTATHRVPKRARKRRSGAISAVVGASKLRYLVVNVDDDGEATFSHGDMDEDGDIESAPVNDLPEM